MQISIDWLKDFVDFDLPADQLAAVLTNLGLESTVETATYDFTGVVVGRIDAVEPLAGSDHLSICQVNLGDTVVPVVCGAPNVTQGIKVPVAKVGAILPYGVKIKKTKIRGQTSQGMICAENELQLSDEQSRIMILDEQATMGQDLQEYLKSQRAITLDLDLTPNRGDCFGHLGVARDLAAKWDTSLRVPASAITEGPIPIDDLATVTITAPEGCHRYVARVITGVTVGPSPEWLVKRLESVGLRAINNVVDASNYVLLELGHPLHIFDYDRLAGHHIDVHFAREGQSFTTLDGVERELGGHHLLIADDHGPVALAGIMGGVQSEVTDQTVNLFIESAYFAPSVIRRGAKSLDLSTDASKRFERDTDIEGLVLALERVTSLVAELAGGSVAQGMIDVYPQVHEPKEIDLSVPFTNRLLGTDLSAGQLVGDLGRLGIAATLIVEETLRCVVPLSRPELTQPVDLIEEIARLEGYDSLPAVEGVEVRLGAFIPDAQAHFSQVRDTLVPWGFHEHLANTLTHRKYTGLFTDVPAIELQNPLSQELAYLRTALLPGLLQAVVFNERRRQKNIQLFEIGAVHHRNDRAYNQTRETFKLGLVVSAGKGTGDVHWKRPVEKDVYYLKGVVARLLQSLALPASTFVPAEAEHLTSVLKVSSNGVMLGFLGEVDETVRQIFGLGNRVVVVELDLDQLGQLSRKGDDHYRDVIPYPVVERDIALEVPLTTSAGDLLDTCWQKGGKYLRDVRIFDLYSGKGIDQDKKSLAFRLYFQSADRTLKDGEVDQQVQRIIDALHLQHQAHWRRS